MKQRIIPVIFVILAVVLATIVIISRNKSSGSRKAYNQPKVITPIINGESKADTKNNSMLSDESGLTSFIPLASDETLINSLTIDFDGDTRDDQIDLVRKVTSPYLFILVGLYNVKTSAYERTAEIATRITQVKTFSFNGLDVVGDHRLALVYQGITDTGESVMQIYLGSSSGQHFRLIDIGNFQSNGTIFIQQSARPEAYELSQANGESFPVWVYSTVLGDDGNPVGDQLQTKYEWNGKSQKYVQTDQLRITGHKPATKELMRLQNGSVKSFGEFLSGLWYKTTNEGTGIRYLSLDYENSEIIQLYNDTEEVYSWGDSYVNSISMYISSENASISNLQRRYYISLVDSDEITLRLQDDLGMTIDESNLWNGSYKRMNTKSAFDSVVKPHVASQDFISALIKGGMWYTADGTSLFFTADGYTVSGDMINDTGKYTGIDIGDDAVISFRSAAVKPYLGQNYEVSYAVIPVPEVTQGYTGKTKKVSPSVDKSIIVMKPVTLTPEGCMPAEERTITITCRADTPAVAPAAARQ